MSRPQEMADSPASGVPQAALEALRGELSGDALAAGDDDYDVARAVWNAMIDRRPAVIARCMSTADVSAAVALRPRATASRRRSAAAATTSPGMRSAMAA